MITIKKIKVLALGMLCVVMNSCSVEDGKDGQDGVGFDELTKYGSITLTLNGKRPDQVPFTKTEQFKFCAVQGSEFDNSSAVIKNGDDLTFIVKRFLSAPDDVFQESTTSFKIFVYDFGTPNQDIKMSKINIQDYAVIGSDLKYFILSDEFTLAGNSGVSDFEIKDFSFNDETNRLKFNYSFKVAGANNDSANEMNVAGVVDVAVLEKVINVVN